MHAFLIVGTDKESVQTKIEELVKKLKVKTLEFPLSKIEDARSLNSFTNLKITSPTAIIINSIEEATPEAVNAFLKNLEEPQEDLYYILTTESVHKVLPTIISRCQVIKIADSGQRIANSEIQKFLEMTVGERLAYTDTIRDRREAKLFVRGLIDSLHQSLHNGNGGFSQTADNLEVAQKTLEAIRANGNVQLHLTNLIIHLTRT